MKLFKHIPRNPVHVVATNLPLASWCNQSQAQSSICVQKVELCNALSAGDDAWGTPVSEFHRHTLLRVSLGPTSSGDNTSGDTLLVERVLSTGGAFHSVIPISETLSRGGTLLYPEVHDRICIIANGPSTPLARELMVERILRFSEGELTLAQFARIVALVGRMTKLICDGGDCTFQARSFAFTCLAALAPTLPPRRAAETMAAMLHYRQDDSIFELGAESFLRQVPRLVYDAASWQTIELINELKSDFKEGRG